MKKLLTGMLLTVVSLSLSVTIVSAADDNPPGWIDLDRIMVPPEAAEVTEINLDPAMLGLVNLDGDESTNDIFSIRVKSFSIDSLDFEMHKRELEQIDSQLDGGNWNQVIKVVDPDEFTIISFCVVDENPAGMLILSLDREEVTLINMLGTIDLSNLDWLGLDEATLDSLEESMEDDEDIEQ